MRPEEQIYCKRCDDVFIPDVGPGTNVHAGRLLCPKCGLFLTWIRKVDAKYFDIPEKKKVPAVDDRQGRLF